MSRGARPFPRGDPATVKMEKERTFDSKTPASASGKKERTGPARRRRDEPLQPKGRVSRDRILSAARTVFARQPYNAASLRAIGKEGGFDPPLIHYYFPTKADLFDAVVENVFNRMFQAQLAWYDGLDYSEPGKALTDFMGRVFDHYQTDPESYRIIFINMAVIDGSEQLPGMDRVAGILAALGQTLFARVPFSGGAEETVFFIHTFMNFILLYLGSAPCKGMVLGMDHMGPEYRDWVIRALTFLFQPVLEKYLPAARK